VGKVFLNCPKDQVKHELIIKIWCKSPCLDCHLH
jgi:hypothetical protein